MSAEFALNGLSEIKSRIERAVERILSATRLIEVVEDWRRLGVVVSSSAAERRAGIIAVAYRTASLLLEKRGSDVRVKILRSGEPLAYIGLSSSWYEDRRLFISAVASSMAAARMLRNSEIEALVILNEAFPPRISLSGIPSFDFLKACSELTESLYSAGLQELASRGIKAVSSEVRLSLGFRLPLNVLVYLGELCLMLASLSELEVAASEAGVSTAWLTKSGSSLSRTLNLEGWVTDECLLEYAWRKLDRAALYFKESSEVEEYLRQASRRMPLLVARKSWYYKLGRRGRVGVLVQSPLVSASEGLYVLGMLASISDRHGRLTALERASSIVKVSREMVVEVLRRMSRVAWDSTLRLLLA